MMNRILDSGHWKRCARLFWTGVLFPGRPGAALSTLLAQGLCSRHTHWVHSRTRPQRPRKSRSQLAAAQETGSAGPRTGAPRAHLGLVPSPWGDPKTGSEGNGQGGRGKGSAIPRGGLRLRKLHTRVSTLCHLPTRDKPISPAFPQPHGRWRQVLHPEHGEGL